jgi:RHS repeat-associated protein
VEVDDFKALTFTNTYYARGANGKVKAVYNLIYDNGLHGDFDYTKPDHFKDEDPTEDDIHYDEYGVDDNTTNEDIPVWETATGTPVELFTPEYEAFLAIYEYYLPKLSEWYIYGSGAQGRFAMRLPDYQHVLYQGLPDLCYSDYESRPIGLKSYEITDHLGNPRVILSDWRLEQYTFNKLATPPNISHSGLGLMLDPIEMNNYFPFGMLKEGMFAKSGNGYRYGFNGMERDNETKGFGNDLSTFFRGYDPRLGRWKSVDPVTKAMESAYVGFGNNPVLFVDPRGDVIDPKTIKKYRENTIEFLEKVHEIKTKVEAYILVTGVMTVKKINDQAQEKHARYEELTGEEPGVFSKTEDYIQAGIKTVGEYTDLEDYRILVYGKTVKNDDAKFDDYVWAGVGAGIPFASGSTVKNSAKNGAEILTEVSKKSDDVIDATKKTTKTLQKTDPYDGIRIINKRYAGGKHPTTGVPFDKDGFPDFKDHLHQQEGKLNDVIITLTGNHRKDVILANEKAGFKKTPKNHTWHHHQENGRMQLVNSDIHDATRHTGGQKIHGEELRNK